MDVLAHRVKLMAVARSIACGALLAGALRAAATPPEAIFAIVGDQHSAYARTAQLVARVDRLKAENPGVPLAVLIDGDTFELGNVVAKRSGGAVEFAMFAALARRAPTVLNLGNHEPEFYDPAETVARARAAGVQVVSGTMRDRATGKPFADEVVRLRLEAGTAGARADAPRQRDVVIAGVAVDALAQYRAAVRPVLDLANPVAWARANFPALFAGAPGAVNVVLSHAGVANDREIFAVVPDGALFAGAHDHLRFVHRIGRTVYVHSGAWNGHLSIARLRRDAAGQAEWEVEQVALDAGDPADPELAALVRETREKFLTAEDRAVVGRLAAALGREEAARLVVRAVAAAAGADAAFVGNTTFGGGLPAGDVSREALDGCVRFDGTICTAEATGAQLREWLAAANPGPDTPFERRRGEPLFGVGPEQIDPAKTYRIATTDWGMKGRARYFGTEALVFTERPELKLKAIAAAALAGK